MPISRQSRRAEQLCITLDNDVSVTNEYAAVLDSVPEKIVRSYICALDVEFYKKEAPLKLTSPQNAGKLFQNFIGMEKEEVFAVAFLTNNHYLISLEKITRGTINMSEVHLRPIARRGLELNAAAIIVGHNHPSGSLAPSNSDKDITKYLFAKLKEFDIRVLDHFIVSQYDFFSLQKDFFELFEYRNRRRKHLKSEEWLERGR